ncbi:hypothetical protein STSO111631_12610 [Stackebrandtia soli]
MLFVVLVCLVVAAAATVYIARATDVGPATGSLSWPEMVAPDDAAPPVPVDATAPIPTPEGLAAAIDPLLSKSALKGTLGISVTDGLTGQELYATDADEALIPASTLKVPAVIAALEAVGPGYRIPTTVVAGEEPGQVILVGHGDVTLSADGDGFYRNAGSLADLADQVKKALDGTEITSVGYDSARFVGDTVAPGVDPGDLPAGYTARLAPLMLDGGRMGPDAPNSPSQRRPDPGMHAARVFSNALGLGEVVKASAAADAEQLGVVHSPPLQQLAEDALLPSDNLLTDAIGLQVALARGEEMSFAGMSTAIVDVLTELGVPVDGVQLSDASGLSEDNRLTATALSSMLTLAASGEHPNASGVFSGLPVAGYNGSLWYRFTGENAAAIGDVRAKTGTLDKVSSIAGTVVSADGRLLVFALLLNGRGDLIAAQDALDAITVAIADCGCR